MNLYAKITLAVLSGVAVGIETGFPHATWAIPVVAAITAALGTMHLVPAVPSSSISTDLNKRAPDQQPSGAPNVPGS